MNTMYALYAPDGRMVRCEIRLKDAVNHLSREMAPDLWNRVFRGGVKESVRAFREYGYHVARGTFTMQKSNRQTEDGMREINCKPPMHCQIPDDVRLWIAKVRDRLEHIHRKPITQEDGHVLLQESIDIAQTHNCYRTGGNPPDESDCSVSLCASCGRANVSCPIYPQDTQHCAEIRGRD